MTKSIEKRGIPVVQVTNLIPVAISSGTNKMVPSISIPYPLGDPNTTEEEQIAVRYNIINTALDALTEEATEQTVYEVKKVKK